MTRTVSRILLAMLVFALCGVGLTAANLAQAGDKTSDSNLSIADFKTLRSAKSTHIVGKPSSAKVVIYQFVDLQCKHSKKVQGALQEIKERHGDDLAIVSYNFPLVPNKNARPAARAVIAASKQGKALEMRELIFAEQKSLKGAINLQKRFAGYAKQLELDVELFKEDYTSKDTKEQLDAELKLGETLGVYGTPTFFINNQRIAGTRTADQFEKFIKAVKK